MKKILGFFTTCVITLLLAGCSPASTSTGQNNGNTGAPVPVVFEDIKSSEPIVFSDGGEMYFKFPDMKYVTHFDSASKDMVEHKYVFKKVDNIYYCVYEGITAIRENNFTGIIGSWVTQDNNLRITFNSNNTVHGEYLNEEKDPETGIYTVNNGVCTLAGPNGEKTIYFYTGDKLYMGYKLTIVTGNDIPLIFR